VAFFSHFFYEPLLHVTIDVGFGLVKTPASWLFFGNIGLTICGIFLFFCAYSILLTIE
jgi:hypothetical protein